MFAMQRLIFIIYLTVTIVSALPLEGEENVVKVVPPEPKYDGSFFIKRNRKITNVLNGSEKSSNIPGRRPLEHVESLINIKKWKPEDGDNIWERSGLNEGDVMIAADTLATNENNTKLWPGAVVPYYIDEKFFDEEKRKAIENSLSVFHKHTCVKFRPYNKNDTDFVYVKGDKPGCWSYVGKHAKGQVINFHDSKCLRHGTIIHEFMHALGFHRQHAARDRDKWVTIKWENIKPNNTHNFVIHYDHTDFGVPYDYRSIMHYSSKAFSKNWKKTIIPKDEHANIGQRFGMSAKDIKRINLMYNCNNSSTKV